jgi:hypothetical protein
MNLLTDFQLVRKPNGEDDQYRFYFGKCDDFQGALANLKKVPIQERKYSAEHDHLWIVEANRVNHAILAATFDNFETCLKIARGQESMF